MDKNLAAKTTLFLTGKIYWAKILGKPVPNYERTGNEWTFEFEPDAEGVKAVKALKLGDRLKTKYEADGRGAFLTLRKKELSNDGSPNEPLRVYDGEDSPWPDNTLIGNGSVGDVKLDVRDYGVGKKAGIYPVALRVTELIKYESAEFGGMDKPDTKPKTKAKSAAPDFKADFNLDDDIPL